MKNIVYEKERDAICEIYTEIIHCLDEAANSVSSARTLDEKLKSIQISHNYLVHARETISVLIESLEGTTGIIADNLSRLYWYSYLKVAESNMRKDVNIMNEVKELFVELLEGYAYNPSGEAINRKEAVICNAAAA